MSDGAGGVDRYGGGGDGVSNGGRSGDRDGGGVGNGTEGGGGGKGVVVVVGSCAEVELMMVNMARRRGRYRQLAAMKSGVILLSCYYFVFLKFSFWVSWEYRAKN